MAAVALGSSFSGLAGHFELNIRVKLQANLPGAGREFVDKGSPDVNVPNQALHHTAVISQQKGVSDEYLLNERSTLTV